ncbi:MAG: hypothetical protein AAFY60_14560, partial [Myxococcota bacterium]
GMASLVSKTVSTAALGYIKTSQKKNSASFPESGSSDVWLEVFSNAFGYPWESLERATALGGN